MRDFCGLLGMTFRLQPFQLLPGGFRKVKLSQLTRDTRFALLLVLAFFVPNLGIIAQIMGSHQGYESVSQIRSL